MLPQLTKLQPNKGDKCSHVFLSQLLAVLLMLLTVIHSLYSRL